MNARSSFDAYLARAVDAHMSSDDEAEELAYELAKDDLSVQEAAAGDASETMDVADLVIRLHNNPRDRDLIVNEFVASALANFQRCLDRVAQEEASRFYFAAVDQLRDRYAP